MNTTSHVGAGTRALALVFLAAVIEGLDPQAAGVAAPKFAPGLQMGLFFSSATFGLIFGALAGGIVADRWGRRAACSSFVAGRSARPSSPEEVQRPC